MSSPDLQRRDLKLTQEEGMSGVKRNIAFTVIIALPGGNSGYRLCLNSADHYFISQFETEV